MPSESSTRRTLLIVYHSRTGGTQQMVEAFVAGARIEDGVCTRVLQAHQAHGDDVLKADGLVFAGPENLASMSGLLKEFFDRTYYEVLDKVQGRPYGMMICAGSDGQSAARQIEQIATGWRLKLIQPAIILKTNAQTAQSILAPKKLGTAELKQCREFGALFATGLALAIY